MRHRNNYLFRAGLVAAAVLFAFAVPASAQTAKPESHVSHQAMPAAASGAPSTGTPMTSGFVQWDEASSRELERELHRLHDIWNAGDIASLRKYIIGDAVLPTFELDPRNHTPITISSSADFDSFIANVIKVQKDSNIVAELEHPGLRCRATTTWGICTEECTVHYKNATDGKRIATDKLRATQVAVRTPEGWRWIQWHMSNVKTPEATARH
jgi:hypothetical protein